MKTKEIFTVKKLTSTMLIVLLLIVTACVDENRKSTKDKDDTNVSETKVKPPTMDIHTAAFTGNLEAIQQHINAGSDLNVREQYGASTPLISATVFGKTEVALALIEAGAELNSKNNEESTALHNAAFFCRTEIVKSLLEHGADKSLKNNYGSTPLESVSGSFETVKPFYDQISKDLGPLGLKLDYKHVESTRPIIAKLLQ
jgi:hypothetical protein